MDIKPLGLCRGSERIYQKVSLTGVGPEDKIFASATDETGRALPAKVLPLDKPQGWLEAVAGGVPQSQEYVVAVPDMHVRTITYTLTAHCADGSQKTASQTIDVNHAKWESRITYRTNATLAHQIRDFDFGKLCYDVEIFYGWAVPEPDDVCLTRVVVRVPWEQENQIAIRLYDEDGHDLARETFDMGTRSIPLPDTHHMAWRERSVSVRMARTRGEVIVDAQDLAHPERHSFDILMPGLHDHMIWETEQRFLDAGNDPEYQHWFEAHRPKRLELERQRTCTFDYMPTWSLVVPLYKTPTDLFIQMLDSVRAQTYQRWELVLVNSTPDQRELAQLVAKAAAGEPRIKVVTLEQNLGISLNTNAGIAVATGDFVGFFDHDDLVEPDLLYEYTKAVNDYPDTDLLYCDEDKILEDGRLVTPLFKPDFDIDALRSRNYVCHLLAVRKSLLDRLEPNTREFDGAQDHNLTLQAFEKGRRMTHVPKMLYHWRVTEQSTAGNAVAKPYAIDAGVRSVQNNLNRMGVRGTVEPVEWPPYHYRVTYDVPEDKPLVSIVIPSCDHANVLRTCVDSILNKSTYQNFEVVVVENNSRERATFDYYDELAAAHGTRVRVVRWEGTGFNYSSLVNLGAAQSRGQYLVLLNNDTEVITPEWLERLLGECARDDVAAVGCSLLYPDSTVQHTGVVVAGTCANHLFKHMPDSHGGYFNFRDFDRECSAVTAACLMVSHADFDAVGGFDEGLAVAYNDVDFCLKLRYQLGKLIVQTPRAKLFHYESLSRSNDSSRDDQIRYQKEIARVRGRWAQHFAEGDPYFNPNFVATDPDICYCKLRW